MQRFAKWITRGAEFIAASLLAAMFFTFLLQIFSRYVLLTPFGWTLELCLILWIWIVFFGCAFLLSNKDHVSFDIFYFAAPLPVRRVFAFISALAIIIGMAYAIWPTWDYIDWMKIRKTSTVVNPFTDQKIPMRTIFSVYVIFMIAVIGQYIWRIQKVVRKGVADESEAFRTIINEADVKEDRSS